MPRRPGARCPKCGESWDPTDRLSCPNGCGDGDGDWEDADETYDFNDDDYDEVVADIQGRDSLDSPKWRRRKRMVVVTGLVIVALFVFWLLRGGSSGW